MEEVQKNFSSKEEEIIHSNIYIFQVIIRNARFEVYKKHLGELFSYVNSKKENKNLIV